MVTVIQVDRKSGVLKPSSLACLSHIPTINLTSGCAHGCLYCYANGYSIHPGKDRVMIYENVLRRVEEELTRKRAKPQAVYFSPSSDLFQPVPEVLELCFSVLEFLLRKDIGIAFVTKGHIPERTMKLLLSHSDKVRAQIGIITVDENIRRIFEPNTAGTSKRLEQMARLVAGGIATEARIVPIMPGFTDDAVSLDNLFHSIAHTGVKRAAISTLFLRQAVAESLKRGISDQIMLDTLLSFYKGVRRLATHAVNSSIAALPLPKREEIYARMKEIASKYFIDLSICACMNTDINCGTCNITGRWQTSNTQRSLFE
ncbi:MAG: radical SAM protein [Chloroflexi bacterium]|nr:radical SAM protein [Chloroflexota bacterium]